MDVKTSLQIVGGLSEPSKMPGYCYNLPASACKTGSKLRKQPNTVCSNCYACKGRYNFSHVKNAQNKRLQSIYTYEWEFAMSFLINRYSKKEPYFRWHDSGDIQSVRHLKKIINVCKTTREVKHWLPTKELGIVKKIQEELPSNLLIRHSVLIIGKKPYGELKGLHTSTVNANYGFQCPVKSGTETCDTYHCRACWDQKVKNVNYKQH